MPPVSAAGAISGSVTRAKTCHGLAPVLAAACSTLRSIACSAADDQQPRVGKEPPGAGDDQAGPGVGDRERIGQEMQHAHQQIVEQPVVRIEQRQRIARDQHRHGERKRNQDADERADRSRDAPDIAERNAEHDRGRGRGEREPEGTQQRAIAFAAREEIDVVLQRQGAGAGGEARPQRQSDRIKHEAHDDGEAGRDRAPRSTAVSGSRCSAHRGGHRFPRQIQKPAFCRHVHVNIAACDTLPRQGLAMLPGRGAAVLARTINSTGSTTSAAGALAAHQPQQQLHRLATELRRKFCRTVVRGGV